jgi:hypothetical protein
VAEAYTFVVSYSAILDRITATDGTVLLDGKALPGALVRYGEEMPV